MRNVMIDTVPGTAARDMLQQRLCDVRAESDSASPTPAICADDVTAPAWDKSGTFRNHGAIDSKEALL
jgi:hypothetical protein